MKQILHRLKVINAGMKKEGVSREAIYINGKYYNQINFAITKKDFLKEKNSLKSVIIISDSYHLKNIFC